MRVKPQTTTELSLFQLHCGFVQSTKKHPGPRVERLPENGDFSGPRRRWKILGDRRVRSHAERSRLGHLRPVQRRTIR